MKKRKYLISGCLLALLFLITYFWLFKNYDIEESLRIIKEVNPWWIVGAAALVFAYMVGEAASIRTGLAAFDTPLSWVRSMQYTALGFYFSSITPSASGGQPMQIYYMTKDDIPLSSSAMALMLISVLFKAVLLLAGLPLVLIKSSLVFTGMPRFSFLFVLGICLVTGMMLLLLGAMFSRSLIYRAVQVCIGLLTKLRLSKNPDKLKRSAVTNIKNYRKAAGFIRANPMLSVKLFAIILAQRAALFSVAYCIYRSFGMQGLSWLDVVAIQVASAFAVDALPLPGAVGISEGVFLGLYSSIYGQGRLVAALLLTRSFTYYLPMVLTGICSAFFHFKQIGRPELIRKVAERKK